MVRTELHRAERRPDVLSHPQKRPHFDAIAWNDRRTDVETTAIAPAAALPANLQEGRSARNRAGAA